MTAVIAGMRTPFLLDRFPDAFQDFRAVVGAPPRRPV